MSTLTVTTLSDGSVSVPTNTVVNGSAKAWVNLNGTGTIALVDSFNVSGLTDIGTGQYHASLTAAMVDGNQVGLGGVGSAGYPYQYTMQDASTLRMTAVDAGGSFSDSAVVQGVAHGDLA